MVALAVHKLSKHFGPTVAVDDIDFIVPDGSLITFLGPSGCGKTTTLRMVAGLETPTAGRIVIGTDLVVDGGHVLVPAERRQIGMVFQSYAVWPHMTVFENVAFPLRARRRPRGEIRDRVVETLRLVQLSELAARYPAQLSGGQQQRVALARALVFAPKLLLLDEPLSNLDASLREQMRIEIRELQQRLGITTIFVTHDQTEALALSDLVALMDRGRIVQLGSPRDIYERPASRFVAEFVGWKNFLPATVIDATTVDLDGRRIGGVDCRTFAPGQRVEIAVRPEDIGFASAGAATVPGVVRTVLFMGTHMVVEVAVGSRALTVHAGATADIVRGTEVGIVLRSDRLRIMAA